MPALLDDLTAAQREAVAHSGGPLIVLGGPGSGKTRTLAARFVALVEGGAAPESLLVLTSSVAAADRFRGRLEAALAQPYEELSVHTFPGLCARLLHDEALEAGLDPFAEPVSPADRLATLLERTGELSVIAHDLGGSPAGLLASFVRRIDRLKAEMVTAADYAAWAAALPEAGDADRSRAAREREFAQVYVEHDRMLAEAGALDTGDLLLRAFGLLRDKPHVRARVTGRWAHVLVDEYQEASFAEGLLLRLLASGPELVVAGDDDQALHRFRGASTKNLKDLRAEHPEAHVVRLERSLRCRQRILDAAAPVAGGQRERIPKVLTGEPGGTVRFWRCAGERAQAQAVAADLERLTTREGVAPSAACVLVRSIEDEGQAVAVALEERAVPYEVVGRAAYFHRAEVRDMLAWLRLLADPGDAGAVVRALARPPVELRSVDLARCTQIARRRKLDMISALVAATESPQIPPEARDRILAFLKLYRWAAAALDTTRPDLFVHRLIERLGLRRQQLFAAQADVVARLRNLARFAELASAHVRRQPQATSRDFARYIAAVAEAGLRDDGAEPDARRAAVRVMTMQASKGLEFDHVYVLGLHAARMPGARQRTHEPIADALLKEALPPDSREAHADEMRRLLHVAMTRARTGLVLAYADRSESGAAQPPSPFVEEARAAVEGEWEEREEELFGPAETLHSTFRMMRDELLDQVSRVGGRLGELRLDTDLDVAHAVVRYLELIKLAALIERAPDQGVAEALPEVNARLLQAATAEQREIFETSALDDYLMEGERDVRRRAQSIAARDEPSLEPFLPRRGDGLMLSASDIETYRTCPLKYKFARVFRIPQEPTLHQRFGILVHQVLERYHGGGRGAGGEPGSLAEMLGLLDAGWRRGGFGDSDEERQLRAKATASLTRYHERFRSEVGEPVWFERSFAFRMGPHLLRGRVDRVDRLPDGGYELIDYKTGRPKTAAQLKDDVQLSLYAVGAREAWQLDAAAQSYYYVLDDAKVPVERGEADRDAIRDTVLDVADGISSQGFEPTPSYAACSMCDFRIVCPAAER